MFALIFPADPLGSHRAINDMTAHGVIILHCAELDWTRWKEQNSSVLSAPQSKTQHPTHLTTPCRKLLWPFLQSSACSRLIQHAFTLTPINTQRHTCTCSLAIFSENMPLFTSPQQKCDFSLSLDPTIDPDFTLWCSSAHT